MHDRITKLEARLVKLEAKPTEMNVNLDVGNLTQELGKWEERLEESRSSLRAWVTSLEEELARVKAQVGDAELAQETRAVVFKLAGRADRFEEVLGNVLRTQGAHLEAIERLTEKVNDLEGMSEGRRAEPLRPWVTGLAEMVARHEARLCELEEEPYEDDIRVLDSAYRGHSAGLERAAAVVESCKSLDEARKSLHEIIGERAEVWLEDRPTEPQEAKP